MFTNLPNWKILAKIPPALKPMVSHFSVFYHKGSTEVIFVVQPSGEDRLSSEVYRASLKVDGCTRLDQLRGKEILKVQARSDVILIVTSQELYAMGANKYGQIGNGEKNDSMVEEPYLVLKTRVTHVDIGTHHCACLTEDGDIYTWGSNTGGQLGYFEESLDPKKVSFGEGTQQDNVKFAEIACWYNVTFGLDRTGRLWGWGENRYYTLIPQSALYQGRSSPRLISFFEQIRLKRIICDDERAFALTEHGAIYAWGRNECGKLGLGHVNIVSEPTRILAFDQNYARIVSILVGTDFTIATNSKGEMYYWGKIKASGGSKCRYTGATSKKEIDSADVQYIEYFTPQFSTSGLSPMELFMGELERTPGLICWNDFKSQQHLFLNALGDQETADLVVKVDGHSIWVHKAILRIRSQHFRRMFQSDAWKEAVQNEIPVDHTSYPVYYAYLHFLYCNELPESLTCEDAFQLIDLAESYFEERLKGLICDFILERSLNVDVVLQTFAMASIHKSNQVASRCMDFILENLATLVKSENFTLLEPVHAKEIFLTAAKADLLKK